MKITALKQQIKNPQRVSVFVDDKYSFSLSLDELIKHKLKNNQELSAADVKKYKKISADGKLRARALEWLMNRPHSEREFRDYLYRKKADPALISSLVDEFVSKNYLSDERYAAWLVDLRIRAGKSDRAIKSELYSKGVNPEAVEQALQGGQEQELERLKQVIAKKSKLSRYQNDPQKLRQYLAAQGFSWENIKTALP